MLSSLNPFNRSQTPPPPLNYDMNKVFIIMKSPLLKKYEEIESIGLAHTMQTQMQLQVKKL
jgi:hypothetical protein